MLLLPLLIAVSAGAHAIVFEITDFFIPEVVGPEEDFAELECHYQADGFTILSFWKNTREFFRFQPIGSPSVKVFNLSGAESVEMIYCGLEACKIKIGGMSQNATGYYKCDIIRYVPPLLAIEKTALMVVQRNEPEEPVVEGLVEEYHNGDTLQAHCRAEPGSILRWFINGQEHIEFRNLTTITKQTYPRLRDSLPRTLSVQCAVHKYGRNYFSKARTTHWCEDLMYTLKQSEHKEIMEESIISPCGSQIITTKAPHKEIIEIGAPHEEIIDFEGPHEEIIENGARIKIIDMNPRRRKIKGKNAPHKEIIEKKSPLNEMLEKSAPNKEIVAVLGKKEVNLIVLCNKGDPIITGFLGVLSTLLNFLAQV